MNGDILKRALDRFFETDMRVMVLKGEWGVGKTELWSRYVDEKIRLRPESFSQVAYSYISLFGQDSVPAVRKSIFQSTRKIKKDSEVEAAFDQAIESKKGLLDVVPSLPNLLKTSGAGWVSKILSGIPLFNGYSSLIDSIEGSLVNNYVVCFDDLERRAKNLRLKDFMGLVDELAARKSCKVIIVFNEKTLEEKDKEHFAQYREKIVDLEVCYSPPYEDNLSIVFEKSDPIHSHLEPLLPKLGLKNIRVIKKVGWLLSELKLQSSFWDDRIEPELAAHVAVFCLAYFQPDDFVPYEEVRRSMHTYTLLSFMKDDESEESEEYKKLRAVVSDLKLTPKAYDAHIVDLLENGVVDPESLESDLRRVASDLDRIEIANKISDAWSIFSDSFCDNKEDFTQALEEVLTSHVSDLELSEFSGAVDALEELGVDVSDYLSAYIEANSSDLAKVNLADPVSAPRVRNSRLRSEIERLYSGNISFDLDEITQRISSTSSWNPEDIEYLASLSSDHYYDWIKSNPDNLVAKIRAGLLRFGNLGGEGSKVYSSIAGKVKEALVRLGRESDMNKRRVEIIYGVSVPSQD